MKNLIGYLKDVATLSMGMCVAVGFMLLFISVMLWDISMFEGIRFWNEGTKAFLRLIALMSIAAPIFVRIKLRFKASNRLFK